MFALWPIGRYGAILGQNHKILLKNRQILEKMYNHIVFTSTVFVLYWSFWGKKQIFYENL
jgi:hypothetical protein